ncbi:MAG: hypothetical protein KAS64_05210, partial [Spirochaetes bacterium]|nr:hypothetical protein [Spirochaetota bacterium]
YFIPDILGYKAGLFMRSFEKKYKRIIGWGGAMAYEASHLIAQAIKNNGAGRDKIKNFLSTLNSPCNSISGITGNLFFDRYGNCMRMISMARVFGGEYKSAKLQLSYVKNINMIKKKDLRDSFLFKGILMSKTLVVYTGVYVNQIETFDVKNSKFTVNFILWFRWWGKAKDIKFKLIQAEELNREVTSSYINPETAEKYICYKIKAKFKQDFSFRKYPFDDHVLKIRIRHMDMPSHKLRFVIDVPDAVLKERYIGFENWDNISQINFVEYIKNIKSFRDPRARGKTVTIEYPVYNYHIQIKRIFLPYLVKFILPLIFILAVAFLAFFIHPKEFESNIAIGITALLSAIAFHITQGENLPNIGYIVTADLFFIFTYALIFLSIVESVVSNTLYYKNKLELAVKIDRVSVFVFPLFLVLLIVIIIVRNS